VAADDVAADMSAVQVDGIAGRSGAVGSSTVDTAGDRAAVYVDDVTARVGD
jgi:hypothetical protein